MELPFLKKKSVECLVNDEYVTFYPVSVAVAAQISDVVKPLARAISILLTDTSNDRGYTNSRTKDGYEQTVINPATTKVIEVRQKQKDQAILDLTDALLDRRSRISIGRIIMDSLREVFPSRRHEQKDVEDFMDSLDIDTFIQLVKGVYQANKGAFGPFVGKVANLLTKKMATIDELLETTEETLQNPSEKELTSLSQEDTQ